MNLEALLEEAVKNPDKRDEFIDRLMQSKGYVIGMFHKTEDGEIDKSKPAELLPIKRGSDMPNAYPLFTDKEKLLNFAKDIAAGTTLAAQTPPILEVNCIDFFRSVRNVSILVNPNAEYGKEFTPAEIENIVTVFTEREKKRRVEVVVPEEEPTDITVDLQYFFKKKKNVERAWIFELRKSNVPPHYLFVVDYVGEPAEKEAMFEEMKELIVSHFDDTDDDHMLQVISAEEELSKKIIDTAEPFYVRKRGLFRR